MLPSSFNPRPAHAERRWLDWFCGRFGALQSTPRSRGATFLQNIMDLARMLQSTPRSRGATTPPEWEESGEGASIHAPLTRSDHRLKRSQKSAGSFNPRPAHAERQEKGFSDFRSEMLQSTPRSRGATESFSGNSALGDASIHAPLTRSDPTISVIPFSLAMLQSTPRSRGATANLTNLHLQFSNTFTIFPY